MEILPTNRVRLIKNVPFSVNYQDVVLFDNATAQQNYFNSLPFKEFDNITYTRNNGQIKVNANRETLLDYNYMYFQNTNYGDKIFYAFITDVIYINPNTSLIKFVIDEWQTWYFDLTFRPTFIERKHCKRWNADGTPVINTVPESLDYGSEYIVKDHGQYNNDLYWVCFVTSLETSESDNRNDVPNPLSVFYLPIYHTSSRIITDSYVQLVSNRPHLTTPKALLNSFRDSEVLVNKLVSCYICEEPPFSYSYEISDNSIIITPTNVSDIDTYSTQLPGYVITYRGTGMLNEPVRSYSKYGNLRNYVTESKLLMYPYSYVQLVDGQGNNFIIKPEYVTSTDIQIATFTSNSTANKIAHIVQNYRYLANVSLSNCRWELQNGIINSSPNKLTIVDDYSAAYLQGNANTIETNIANVQLQAKTNNTIAQNNMNSNLGSVNAQTVGNMLTGAINGGISGATMAGGIGAVPGAIGGAITNGVAGLANYTSSYIQGRNYVENTELQGNVTEEKTIASAMAKIEDAENVADNVSLQGGDVFFTYQNKYNGYCLVYKQISDEYIAILEDYFQKYGYKVNIIETPNLHTRQSWDYIRTVGCNVIGSINADSLEKIRTIFNNGVTIWHTTDVGNYNLSNNEI